MIQNVCTIAVHFFYKMTNKTQSDLPSELRANYSEGKESKANGEPSHFFNQYLLEVQSLLLQIIVTSLQCDWIALDKQINHFFTFDLLAYVPLMPLHLAQMNQLEINSGDI